MANGVRFDWLIFGEWYGGKPGFPGALEDFGLFYVTEVPKDLPCFPSLPRYRSLQRPFAAKRTDKARALGQAVQWQALEEGPAEPQHAGPADMGGT